MVCISRYTKEPYLSFTVNAMASIFPLLLTCFPRAWTKVDCMTTPFQCSLPTQLMGHEWTSDTLIGGLTESGINASFLSIAQTILRIMYPFMALFYGFHLQGVILQTTPPGVHSLL